MSGILTVSTSWLVIVTSVTVWLVLCWLGVLNWRRSQGRRAVLMLEGVRLLLAALVVVTLWRPEMRLPNEAVRAPSVVVLRDASRSMTTQDMPGGDQQSKSRRDWVDEQKQAAFWGPLSNQFNVVTEDFSGVVTNSDAEEGTDLGAALERTMANVQNVRAVLLFSDGDWNQGVSPVAAATRMRLQKVPVFAVGVGAETFLPDLAVERVMAPEYGQVGEQVFIGFTVRNHLEREVKTTVVLKDNRGMEMRKPVTIPASGLLQDAIFWVPTVEGTSRLTLSVPVEDGEFRRDNNEQTFEVAARKEVLNVLVVESLPRWEYRYLRNAMQRDPGVNVQCVLFHPGMSVGGGRDYLPGIPKTKEVLSKFDVVFLGDVGLNDGELTPLDMENLRGLVEQQGSGLVFLPGRRGRIFSMLPTALGGLIPVELDVKNQEGLSTTQPARLTLTPRGRGHLLTMLATTEEGNAELWKSLPGFSWYAPVLKSKGGAEVLAVHELARNEWGRVPLLVTRLQGNGKVLFMGTDAAWRWRYGVEDTYHYRFWGQVVRWMAYQRHLAQDQGIRVFYSPENPTRGAMVHVNATAFDNQGLPLKGGQVEVELTSPKGEAEKIELRSAEGDWGVFEGEFMAREQGTYRVKARCVTTGREIATDMAVRGASREQVGRPAQMEVLREVARITQGEFGGPLDLPRFVQRIEALPAREPVERRLRLWCHPGWGALIVVLLTVFWVGRKLAGMV